MLPLGQRLPARQVRHVLRPAGFQAAQRPRRHPARATQRRQHHPGQPGAIGRIEKDQPAGGFGPGRTRGIAGDDTPLRLPHPAGGQIRPQHRQRRAVALDEAGPRRAARQRLQPQRPGPGEGVEHKRALHPFPPAPGRMPQHVEQRLPHPVRRRPRPRPRRCLQPPPAPPPGHDPHGWRFPFGPGAPGRAPPSPDPTRPGTLVPGNPVRAPRGGGLFRRLTRWRPAGHTPFLAERPWRGLGGILSP